MYIMSEYIYIHIYIYIYIYIYIQFLATGLRMRKVGYGEIAIQYLLKHSQRIKIQ